MEAWSSWSIFVTLASRSLAVVMEWWMYFVTKSFEILWLQCHRWHRDSIQLSLTYMEMVWVQSDLLHSSIGGTDPLKSASFQVFLSFRFSLESRFSWGITEVFQILDWFRFLEYCFMTSEMQSETSIQSGTDFHSFRTEIPHCGIALAVFQTPLVK